MWLSFRSLLTKYGRTLGQYSKLVHPNGMSHEEPRRERRELRRDLHRRRKLMVKLLRKARKGAGLTQKTVALMLGTTQPNVGKLERSGRVPFIVVERLAAIYDVPLSYFATLDADTRTDGKYLGMTNEQWSAYYSQYNRPRCRTGRPPKTYDARRRAISVYDPRVPVAVRSRYLGEGWLDE